MDFISDLVGVYLSWYNAGGFHYNFVSEHINLHLGGWAESKVKK